MFEDFFLKELVFCMNVLRKRLSCLAWLARFSFLLFPALRCWHRLDFLGSHVLLDHVLGFGFLHCGSFGLEFVGPSLEFRSSFVCFCFCLVSSIPCSRHCLTAVSISVSAAVCFALLFLLLDWEYLDHFLALMRGFWHRPKIFLGLLLLDFFVSLNFFADNVPDSAFGCSSIF